MKTEPRALRMPQAADYVGLKPATLEKMRVEGNGPPFCRLSRAIVYLVPDLDAWMAAHRFRSTTEADAAMGQRMVR